jgi:tetratricopeptide (TPR) repeat protein
VKRSVLTLLALTVCVSLFGVAPARAAAAPAKASPAVVDSLGLLERAVAKDSTNWDNLYRLGAMYLDRDRPQDAVKVLSKASRVKAGHVPTLVNLGAAYDAMGTAKVAQDIYRQALKLAPGDTIATCRLASSLYSVNDYAGAMELLRTTIAANPRAYCAWFTLGVAFADAGIYTEAIRSWQKVVQIAPSSPEAISAKESIDVLQRVLQTKSN